jgi:acetylornithine deacetylase
MNVFELTRKLVDIESVTENEAGVGAFLLDYARKLASRTGGQVERMEVEAGRFNVLAWWGTPAVTLSTHMDTVPPFFASREDDEFIWGRGACDAKGIIAAMVSAAEDLLAAGTKNFALLFVVGEERNSAGAAVAARAPRGSRYLINGEPTENKLVLASKGVLRFELVAQGRMAHSAYPELGASAIEALLDALEAIRRVPLPSDSLLGPSTLNIGTISGGRAPNVIADAAKAELMIRLVGDPAPIREAFEQAIGRAFGTSAAGSRAQLNEILCIPALRFRTVDGLPTSVVSFATDIPMFGKTWGEPLLIGPGSIHVAHTSEEHIPKRELSEAVGIYAQLVRKLQAA